MKQYVGLLTTAIFLSVLPGAGLAQKDAGIPPMLETQRPLATTTTQPEPQPPQAEVAKPGSQASTGKKTKKVQQQKMRKTNVAGQKKTGKAATKKGATAKPRSKVAASH